MTQTIGFIGTGMIGSALARLATKAGYSVILSNSRGPEALADFISELGSNARAATIEDVCDNADIVVASVPLGAYKALPAERLAGKVVIDTMNYYPDARDGKFPQIDAGEQTTSEMIQAHLPEARLVKALHNLDFHHLFANARPEDHPERTTLPIAGDDEDAKKTVASFMNNIGYTATDIGSLSESWRIEPGTPIYVWPYVPKIPEGLSAEDARKWYLEHPGKPLSPEQVQDICAKTEKHFPIGGFPADLPEIHVQLVGEIYQARNG